MKLYLVHAGFYDENISGGFYESHTNYFIAANDVKEAKIKAKQIPEYKKKKMHIDGIKVIEKVENYSIQLLEDKSSNNDSDVHYTYDDIKKMK
tara:strand:+ start:439 stop:717 length:279 start_codon:yes stop_codon:yes gene_type:complete